MSSLAHRLPFVRFLMRAAAPAVRRPEPRPAAARPLSAELDELRGEAMRRLFPKLYLWWATRGEWGAALQVHAYLSEATTVEELEARVQHVERQRQYRH